MIIDLRKPNLREVEEGSIVTTTVGFEFMLVTRVNGKELWQDKTSGLLWHDVEDKKYNYGEAMEKFGDKLPTIEEFEIAETHGFREVLPNIGNWFWSASLFPNYEGVARVFSGDYGYSYYGYRDYDSAVRCVGR